MNIGSYQAFLGFIGKDTVPMVDRLQNCVKQLNIICNCQRSRKSQKSEECNKIYIDLVNSTVGNLIDYLKTKTTDSEIIFSHNGSHEIKRIKLR